MKLLSLLLILSLTVSAAEKQEHREHGAHVHGSAQVSLAFEGAQGALEVHAPAEGILGFEHKANSAADKKLESDQLNLLESKIGEMVVFERQLQCLITKEKIEVGHDGSHADVDGDFKVSCAGSPVGTKITFNIQKYFPGMKNVDITVLAENLQKNVKAKTVGTILQLHK